ncbi:MAG: hypothetical protein KC505_01190 [Myxococcales bacterium]|nr:hypothetical protein [Myxococcales bacterium]USN50851.1 MAG: hypothetical protein H6731_00055 [Myxococcales bacterium]
MIPMYWHFFSLTKCIRIYFTLALYGTLALAACTITNTKISDKTALAIDDVPYQIIQNNFTDIPRPNNVSEELLDDIDALASWFSEEHEHGSLLPENQEKLAIYMRDMIDEMLRETLNIRRNDWDYFSSYFLYTERPQFDSAKLTVQVFFIKEKQKLENALSKNALSIKHLAFLVARIAYFFDWIFFGNIKEPKNDDGFYPATYISHITLEEKNLRLFYSARYQSEAFHDIKHYQGKSKMSFTKEE